MMKAVFVGLLLVVSLILIVVSVGLFQKEFRQTEGLVMIGVAALVLCAAWFIWDRPVRSSPAKGTGPGGRA